MKRSILFITAWALCAMPAARCQDAATEERLNKLSGQIEDLIASQKTLRDQVSALTRELQSVRDEQGKPNTSYISREEFNRLADAIKEVDRKRIEDNEKIHNDLVSLGKTLAATPAPSHPKRNSVAQQPPPDTAAPDKTPANIPDKGFEHVVQSGDTLSLIVQGCRDKNIKVTIDQIIKANPGLKPERLKVGQKIFIPAAQS